MKQYRVLTINPGSTSTKIALFEGENCLFSKNVAHDASELAKFKTIPDQLPYREKTILDLLAQEDVDLSTVDVFVGRGGGLLGLGSLLGRGLLCCIILRVRRRFCRSIRAFGFRCR
ncbi:MAG: hypothetical protein ABS874_08250 [Lachnospiraceae bacterium]